jgi:hypothetical protein
MNALRGIGHEGISIYGHCIEGTGAYGHSDSGIGIEGKNQQSGNYGYLGSEDYGAYGKHDSSGNHGFLGGSNCGAAGVHFDSQNGAYIGTEDYGVYAWGSDGGYFQGGARGVYGEGQQGVYGEHTSSGNYGYLGGSTCGVYGNNTDRYAVRGDSDSGWGVYGYSTSGRGVEGSSATGHAGYFTGKVAITGNLSKGSGSFKIDHPLDPENKYLQHSFVESPDMMNVYNGNVKLDENGQAVVQLPEYFEALNCDFRYQLTPIGAPGPNLYIAEKVSDNRFKIAGGKSGMEVSWQVTGIRHDPYAVANRIQVEEDKPDQERGYYLHPNAYGLPKERGIETVRGDIPSQTQEVAKKELSNESDKHYN